LKGVINKLANDKSPKRNYRVLYPLRRDGQDHAVGSVLELTQEEADSIGTEVIQRVARED